MDKVTRLIVNGETFEVTRRAGRQEQYDFRWLTGPNQGYGFSMALGYATTPGAEREPVDLRTFFEQAVADFLAEIDPATGYLRD